MKSTTPIFLAALLVVFAGCLPSSCGRGGAEALFPADSLSRQLAAEVPVDTLRRVWRTGGSEAHPLQFPRTVLFGEEGEVYVSDAERNSVFVFAEEGELVREVALPSFEVPYLAGRRGDTLLVLSPFERRIDFVLGAARVGGMRLPVELPEAPLVWATASDASVYVKVLSEGAEGFVARVDRRGAVTAQQALPGPVVRRAGPLRLWGDSLLSLSGYRPVVDVLPAGADFDTAPLDTMALQGFDSPMLARSRAFAVGEITRPPLLLESAAPAAGRLFVLNLRPGWLRIDVFDHSGRLTARLTQPDPAYGQDFYPRDLAVRQNADGSYALAVVFTEPAPLVVRYRWQPGARAGLAGR